MKNLKKYFVMSLAMCVMVLALSMSSVKATSGGLMLSTDITPTPAPTTTPTPVPTATPTPKPTIMATTPTPVPTGADLPQTGENDIYIVSSIGLVVLVIGGVAYIKSKKYSI